MGVRIAASILLRQHDREDAAAELDIAGDRRQRVMLGVVIIDFEIEPLAKKEEGSEIMLAVGVVSVAPVRIACDCMRLAP